jgi:photosystem II stability/assembly factor-like uncharacterized protein
MIISEGCENITEPHTTWKRVRKAQGNYFDGLWFVDQNNGWAVGHSGRILNTSDGGDSWGFQESGIQENLKCVMFINKSSGFIGGANNSLGFTTNGGISWTWQNPDGESRRTFMDISFVDENNGWVVDNYGGILHTEDGGRNWIPQSSGTNYCITSVQFLDILEGWATATNRIVLHTTDGGNIWTKKILDSLEYGIGVTVVYEDICFVSPSKGWISTTSAISVADYHPTPIVSTSDAGETWICRSTPEDQYIRALTFIDDYNGWAAACNGIIHTNDGVVSWKYQVQKSEALFIDICFIGQSYGWALTFRGEIYRYQ